MSNNKPHDALPPLQPPAANGPSKHGFWGLIGNAAVLGLLGTVFVSVFQYISAYHNSVANLAKTDLDKGVSTLAETVATLSTPLSLQGRLIWAYALAQEKPDAAAAYNDGAHSIYKDYDKSFTTLSAATSLLARKMEIYLDLPGDLDHAATRNAEKVAPVNISNLHNFNFDCLNNMPAIGSDSPLMLALNEEPTTGDESSNQLAIHWKSAKDNLATLEYCLEDTHYKMKRILNWASTGADDKTAEGVIEDLKKRSKLQGQRFNDFMSVATFKIEGFRVRYQPREIFCTVPFIDTLLDHVTVGHVTRVCTPQPIAPQ